MMNKTNDFKYKKISLDGQDSDCTEIQSETPTSNVCFAFEFVNKKNVSDCAKDKVSLKTTNKLNNKILKKKKEECNSLGIDNSIMDYKVIEDTVNNNTSIINGNYVTESIINIKEALTGNNILKNNNFKNNALTTTQNEVDQKKRKTIRFDINPMDEPKTIHLLNEEGRMDKLVELAVDFLKSRTTEEIDFIDELNVASDLNYDVDSDFKRMENEIKDYEEQMVLWKDVYKIVEVENIVNFDFEFEDFRIEEFKRREFILKLKRKEFEEKFRKLEIGIKNIEKQSKNLQTKAENTMDCIVKNVRKNPDLDVFVLMKAISRINR